MKTIRSNLHELSSYEINKISLSCLDDKRYILADGVSSYAYGHYLLFGSHRTIVHDLAQLRTFPLVSNQSNT